MALESITLPSRLRADQGTRGMLDEMAALLNVNGNQRIATLECSILKAAYLNDDATLSAANIDQRVPGGNTSVELHGEDGIQEANVPFDMALSWGEARTSAHGTIQHRAREHVFSRLECLRNQNEEVLEISNGEEDEMSRKRRRLAGVPITRRFVLFDKAHCSGVEIGNMHGLMQRNTLVQVYQADGVGLGTFPRCSTH